MNSSGPQTHDISIGDDSNGIGAHPGQKSVSAGDLVKISTTTPGLAKLNFSNEKLFNTAYGQASIGKPWEGVVQDIEPGEYPYAVFCLGADVFAHGSAMPIIIVEPKK